MKMIVRSDILNYRQVQEASVILSHESAPSCCPSKALRSTTIPNKSGIRRASLPCMTSSVAYNGLRQCGMLIRCQPTVLR